MPKSEHLPGCDERHTTRQRCSTYIEPVRPAVEDQTQSTLRADARVRPPWRLLIFVVVFPIGALGLLFFGALTIGTVLIAADASGLIDIGGSAPRLPEWAQPISDELDQYPGCGGNLDRPPCRTYWYGVVGDFTEERTRLVRVYREHGWYVETREWQDALKAVAPDDEVCVFYTANKRDAFEARVGDDTPPEERQRLDEFWGPYAAKVQVTVDDCSWKG